MREKLQLLYDDHVETMEVIVSHVSNGGSLIDLCKTWGVPYFRIIRWIKMDPEKNKEYEAALQARNEWARESILMELKKMIGSNLQSIINEDGSLKPVHDWPDEIASVVQSIEVVEEFEGSGRDRIQTGWNKKVKFWSKEKAIELFGKHIKLFTDQHEINGTMKLEEIIGRSMKIGKKTDE